MTIYRYSLKPILFLFGFGLFLTLIGLPVLFRTPFLETIAYFLVQAPFYGTAYYFYKQRKQGHGYYFDNEGITIDLKETKIYWHEIEEIKFMTFKGFKSTVIYPHYTFHEKIRERRGKTLPTTAHSIEWTIIERPKTYHEEVLLAFEKWQKLNNTAS